MSVPFNFMRNPAVEAEAVRFSNALVSKFFAESKKYPHLDSICIDYMDGYPSDEILDRVEVILANRYRLERRQFQATSGRAGCIWVSVKS